MKINNAICHGASLCLSVLVFPVVCSDSKGAKNPAENLKRLAKVEPPTTPSTFTEIAHRQMCSESCKLQGYENQGQCARKKLQENALCSL